MSARGRKRTKRFLRDRKAGNCIKKEIVNMANRVITIAREYGSGGRSIGKMLARELVFAFYDDEILRMASDESGIKLDLFGEMDEYIPAFARLRRGFTVTSGMSATAGLRKVAMEISTRPSAVMKSVRFLALFAIGSSTVNMHAATVPQRI